MKADSRPHDLDAMRDEEFVRHYSEVRARLFVYISNLLPHWADAEDVLQQTSILLNQKFDQYDPRRSFFNWARGIAYRTVLNFRKLQRRRHQVFNEAVLEKLSRTQMNQTELFESRRLALADCVTKLAPSDRQIVERYYYEGGKTVAEVANELSRPTNTLLRALVRIRRALRLCVDRSIAREYRK